MLNRFILKRAWLKQEEVPILVVRTSLLNKLPQLFFGFLFLAGLFFVMPWLWQWEFYGLIIFFVILFLWLLWLGRFYYSYYFTLWLLTNFRLIDFYQKGWFFREKTEVSYDKITEIYGRKNGLSHGLFNLGNIYLTSADGACKLKLDGVRGYERAISEITLQQENYQRNLSLDKNNQAHRLLLKIKNKIGAETFKKLIS